MNITEKFNAEACGVKHKAINWVLGLLISVFLGIVGITALCWIQVVRQSETIGEIRVELATIPRKAPPEWFEQKVSGIEDKVNQNSILLQQNAVTLAKLETMISKLNGKVPVNAPP